jgi:hypothetical protein
MKRTAKIVAWTIVIVILVVLGIALSAGRSDFREQGDCLTSAKDGCPTPQIKIGVIAPLTGPFADYGEEVRKGVEAGIGSDQGVQLIFEDEKCDPKTAVSAFQKLASVDHVKFIIGPGCGSPQEAVAPLLAENRVIMFVPSAASKELFQRSGGYFYNVQYSLEDESRFIADEMYKRGFKNVALITYGNAFSDTHKQSFDKSFKGTIGFESVLLDDSSNLLPELTKAKAAKIDAVYAPDVSFFFGGGPAKMKQLGLNVPVYTTYIAELPSVRPVVEGAYYSFPEKLIGAEGAVFNLSREAAVIVATVAAYCKGDTLCAKEKLDAPGSVYKEGVKQRSMTLKRILNGAPISAF